MFNMFSNNVTQHFPSLINKKFIIKFIIMLNYEIINFDLFLFSSLQILTFWKITINTFCIFNYIYVYPLLLLFCGMLSTPSSRAALSSPLSSLRRIQQYNCARTRPLPPLSRTAPVRRAAFPSAASASSSACLSPPASCTFRRSPRTTYASRRRCCTLRRSSWRRSE